MRVQKKLLKESTHKSEEEGIETEDPKGKTNMEARGRENIKRDVGLGSKSTASLWSKRALALASLDLSGLKI